MNAQNAKDYLPLIKALSEGKTIQFHDGYDSCSDSLEWKDQTEFNFDHAPTRYRVKPDRWWICIDPFTKTPHAIYTSRANVPCGYEPIEVEPVKK